ncbi:MAG: glycosyltransferase [Rhodospirillales bacterium]
MTVLWIAHGYPCPQFPGLGAFIKVQAQALAPTLPHLDIVTPVSAMPWGIGQLSPRWRRVSEMPAIEQGGNVTVHRPRYFAHPHENRFGLPHRFMLRAIRGLGLARPAIMHAHCGVPHGWVALQLAREWGVPYAMTLLGSDVAVFAKATAGARQRFVESVRSADAVFAVGSRLADETEVMTGRRPDVLHYGVREDWLTAPRDKSGARARLGLPNDGFIGLFVGQLSVAKGVADLARAIKQFSAGDGAAPAQWLFVGDGPLRAMLEELPTCRLAGAVDHLALRDYYDAADALFLPSHQEGLPTVTLEAGSRGLPVAAADVGSVRDVVSADTGWLLRPRNDDDLLQAMRAAASAGSEALGSRGDRLFQIVRTTYSAATNAATVRERYATLCKALG